MNSMMKPPISFSIAFTMRSAKDQRTLNSYTGIRWKFLRQVPFNSNITIDRLRYDTSPSWCEDVGPSCTATSLDKADFLILKPQKLSSVQELRGETERQEKIDKLMVDIHANTSDLMFLARKEKINSGALEKSRHHSATLYNECAAKITELYTRPASPTIVWKPTMNVHVATDIPLECYEHWKKSNVNKANLNEMNPTTKSSRMHIPTPPKKKKVKDPKKMKCAAQRAKRLHYGAWYFPPEQWHVEQPHVSRISENETDSGSKKRSVTPPELFITTEYRKFINNAGHRLPQALRQ